MTVSHIFRLDISRPKNPQAPYVLGPDDVRGEHGGQVDGGHLVGVLVAGGVVQQVQQQLQQAAVGRWQQHEEQLEGLDLTLLVGNIRLVPLLVKQSAFWEKRPTKTRT